MATFRIGLAMAGAVSAGAYTAGVLDFLFEALDQWQTAKDSAGPSAAKVPQHDVKLSAISGASAGSMCAAQIAVLAHRQFPHIRLNHKREPLGAPHSNIFYSSWVQNIDIQKLLNADDLRDPNTGRFETGELKSLLNSDPIDAVLADCLGNHGAAVRRPWIEDPLVLRLTVGNLRGIPYAPRGTTQGGHFDAMTAHADHMAYLIGPGHKPTDASLSDHRKLDPHSDPDQKNQEDWKALGETALASGAFPLGLKARKLSRPGSDYDNRYKNSGAWTQPSWGGNPPDPYEFICVDGGVFENEPFDLAESALKLFSANGDMPGDAESAHSAILMIDPFVDAAATPEDVDSVPLNKLIGKLISAWVSQSRFRPKQIAEAEEMQLFHRYMIAPVRRTGPQGKDTSPIASGGLGGFLGFFSEEFRKHDYQLGRRNCQKFLRNWLTVPAENKILSEGYAGFTEDEKKPFLSDDGDGELQIIPLMPEMQVPEPLPEWPAGAFNYESIKPLVHQRVDAIYAHYYGKIGGSLIKRKALQAYVSSGWRIAGRKLVLNDLEARIEKAVKDQQLT